MSQRINSYLTEDNRVKLTRDLTEKGYCIIEDILTDEEIIYSKNLFYEWQKTIPNHDEVHHKIDPHGIYKYHEAGHQRHAWYIRTRPKVQAMFKYLWNAKSLITSFDGSCYIDKNFKGKDKCWTHTDQGPQYDSVCYQSFVSLTENKERTLVIYEKSHLYHKQYFMDKNIKSSKNWNLIDINILDEIKDTKKVLHVPAGALVIWDSRCFHQNQYGAPNSEERIVQYICYFPADHKKNTAAMINKRVKYYNERRTTSHWPCPISVNSKQPRTFGDQSLIIDYDTLQKPYLDDMANDIYKLL